MGAQHKRAKIGVKGIVQSSVVDLKEKLESSNTVRLK
ncbi:hypothetical protein QG37_04019 [Candidozyma auris]|nr:hypothetical protein QG37_04019 [[Candida] auris]